MVETSTPPARASQHDMLTPASQPALRPGSGADSYQGQERQASRAPRAFDPMPILIATLLFVGLASLALGAWFIYMRQFADSKASSTGLHLLNWPNRDLEDRLQEAEATRDAQQIEMTQLRNELRYTQQELSRVSAQLVSDPDSTRLDKPPLALILDVPIYKQEHSLSCESSAAAMAANFQGVAVSEQDIMLALPYDENPYKGFRGNIDGPHGGTDDYGVYAAPVQQTLAARGLQAELLQGGPDEIRAYIRQGKPVIVWITYGMQAQVPVQVTLTDGQTVTMVPFEHTVVVIGYNRDGLWVNDPYAGTQDFYPEGDFVRSFGYLGNMGLVVGPPADR
jgi:uncharacterized protein YvpB